MILILTLKQLQFAMQNSQSFPFYFIYIPKILMKRKLDSSSSDKDGTIQYEEISNNHLHDGRQQQTEKKIKKKVHYMPPRISTQNQGRASLYSTSEKMTSYIKGYSVSDADTFKYNDSIYFNQVAEKYVPRGAPHEKIKEEMLLALERKTSELEALRVHRDQLKFISYNNPYDMPIKISLAMLKQKARTQQKIKDMKHFLRKDINELEKQFDLMTDYYNFITNSLKSNGQDDLIIDTQEEEKLMIENLQKENHHLFRELKDEDKKNAKEIKNMQEQIGLLRIYIKQKEDKIRDLKSKICFLHIKLHSKGSNSKQKNMSLSIRKFITSQNSSVQEAFVGNISFKNYSKQIIEKVSNNSQLRIIKFYFDKKKELLTFKCVYKHSQGKIHFYEDQVYNGPPINTQMTSPKNIKKELPIEIKVKYLLSFKFYFKSKVVGVECRLKNDKGTQTIQIGNCSSYLQHELLTMINKQVVTLGSYWHQKDLIGIGVWYCSKNDNSRNTSLDTKQKTQKGIRTIKSQQFLSNQRQLNNDYYN